MTTTPTDPLTMGTDPSTNGAPRTTTGAETEPLTARASTTTSRPPLGGAMTALVTPFTPTGELDETAFRGLLARQLEGGIDGLVPCGTTGESPTLTQDERDRLIELTIDAVRGGAAATRPSVVAGTGTNDTRATIAATRRAAELGADAALVVAPYYNKPDQRMLEAHYRAVADEGDLPVVVYNVPGRTGTNVSAETLLRLAEHPRIVAVKEASGDLEQIMTILRDRPAGFAVLSGDDSWTLPVMGLGGDGVISVASNQVPETMVALCRAARQGDWATARAIHERYLDLFRVNFVSPNPVPVKASLAAMGLMSDVLRPPLLPLAEAQRARVREVMAAVGLAGAATAGSARMGSTGSSAAVPSSVRSGRSSRSALPGTTTPSATPRVPATA